MNLSLQANKTKIQEQLCKSSADLIDIFLEYDNTLSMCEEENKQMKIHVGVMERKVLDMQQIQVKMESERKQMIKQHDTLKRKFLQESNTKQDLENTYQKKKQEMHDFFGNVAGEMEELCKKRDCIVWEMMKRRKMNNKD